MVKIVIKKSGEEEPFDIEKLKQSIRVNAIDTTLREAEKETNDLVERVSNKILQRTAEKEKITTKELKEEILKELDATAPNVAGIWREFDKQSKGI